MTNYFKDNDDLAYYFDRGLPWAELVEVAEHGFRAEGGFKTTEEALAFYREVLEMVGDFVASEIAPKVPAIDREGVHLENGEARVPAAFTEIFDKLNALELHGMSLPRELGGMNAPFLVSFVVSEMIGRADTSMMTHFGFHGVIAMALLMMSLREGSSQVDRTSHTIKTTRFEKQIREIAQGLAWGAMDITEPDAGSDMARLKARGEQDADGNWFVTGQKIFITSGHAKHHLVIARTEPEGDGSEAAGLKGLSMFLVEAYSDDEDGTRRRVVTMDRFEEKLGHHASVTASLQFERAPAQLIGKRGEGFRYMLMMMNDARVGVGFESLGLCENAYRLARDYAAERRSMGKTIDRHELIADMLDEMRTDIQGIRAVAMSAAFHEELAQRLRTEVDYYSPEDPTERKTLRRRQRTHERKARRLTPLLKYLASEKAVEMARRCIQIHGGNGYTREYGAEKLLRDALVLPIYEGTSQIQALMAMKDTLGDALKHPQAFLQRQAKVHWRSVAAKDPLEKRVAKLRLLVFGAINHLLAQTAASKLKPMLDKSPAEWPSAFKSGWDPKRDFAVALLHAERLTRMLADESVCVLLLGQATEHADRRDVLERYLERAEPRMRFLHDEIMTTGSRILGTLA